MRRHQAPCARTLRGWMPAAHGAAWQLRPCSAAAASEAAESPAQAKDVLPNERAEHDQFMAYCYDKGKLTNEGAAPIATCSASRRLRVLDEPRRTIIERGAHDEAMRKAQEGNPMERMPGPVADDLYMAATEQYDFRGGRGLVATEDVGTGRAMLRAPVNAMAINVDTIGRHHAAHPRYGNDEAANIAFKALPDAGVVLTIVLDMMVRDAFYQHQLHLATHLAWERYDPHSHLMPVLNALPVPAVDDDVVLTVHAGGLSSVQANEYYELHQDFLYALKRIRHAWIDRIMKLSVGPEAKERAKARVPPIQVLDWAWRTVLSRQTPLPIGNVAPGPECFRGAAHTSVNFSAWYEVQGLDHKLMPSLSPFFDLVGHGETANVEIDVLMRPMKPDGHVNQDLAEEFTHLHTLYDSLAARTKRRKPRGGGHFAQRHALEGYGSFYLMTVMNRCKSVLDRAQRAIVGETGGDSESEGYILQETLDGLAGGTKDTAGAKIERAKRLDIIGARLKEIEATTVGHTEPVVEMRATRPIERGEPLVIPFAKLHSRSFTLYRFGFEPQ